MEPGAPFLFHISSFSLLCHDMGAQHKVPPQLVLPNGDIAIGQPVGRIKAPAEGSLAAAAAAAGDTSSSSSGNENGSPPSDFERFHQLQHGPVIVYATKDNRGFHSAGRYWWPLACLFAAFHFCIFAAFLRGSPDYWLCSGVWAASHLSLVPVCLYTSLSLADFAVFYFRVTRKAEAVRALRVVVTALLALQFFFSLATLLDVMVLICTCGLLFALMRVENDCTSHIFCVYP